uniref:Uncharacterized protein n=1 Tax=Anguilla anguilla TaxID=7936 RepID=A0A0E9W2D5_ANGAN
MPTSLWKPFRLLYTRSVAYISCCVPRVFKLQERVCGRQKAGPRATVCA